MIVKEACIIIFINTSFPFDDHVRAIHIFFSTLFLLGRLVSEHKNGYIRHVVGLETIEAI